MKLKRNTPQPLCSLQDNPRGKEALLYNSAPKWLIPFIAAVGAQQHSYYTEVLELRAGLSRDSV
jgi:hypothetical protein